MGVIAIVVVWAAFRFTVSEIKTDEGDVEGHHHIARCTGKQMKLYTAGETPTTTTLSCCLSLALRFFVLFRLRLFLPS